jgi:small subunit ribosomal protein S1
MAKFHYIDPNDQSTDPFGSESHEPSEFEKLLSTDKTEVSARRYKIGEQVTGKVVTAGQEFVFVDLGGKVAAAVAIDEFRTSGTGVVPSPGDEVSLFVREDNGSEVVLTRSLRRNEADDLMLRNAYEQGLPIDAKVEKTNKGGFEVSLGAKRGFVPMGNMDIIPIDDAEQYVGKVLKFVIVQYTSRNLILSRRAVLREEQEQQAQELLGTLEVGQQKRARITRLATFGAFADIGGVEGLIPMSELSWVRVKSVEDVLKVGDTVQVKVNKIERVPKLKISLSLKAAAEDPWICMATRLTPGTQIEGKVSRLVDFGAYVVVGEGVEGLIHVSQLTWEKRVNHPREIVQEGARIGVHILNVDFDSHRLSLSLKGPMPTDVKARLETKRRTSSEFSTEELEMAAEWDRHQKTFANAPTSSAKSDTNAMAAAFANAKLRKS